MGANIGTTATAWIVSLGEWTQYLKPSVLAPICIIIGIILLMVAKRSTTKHIGEIIFGFGTLFLGLDMMSDAAKPLRELESIKNAFVVLGHNPILGILAGALVTAIIQSSSASVGILQALALAGLVPWSSAVYIIFGQNIGTCVTAALSSIGASTNAKRAATVHFLFNFIGSAVFGIIAVLLLKYVFPTLAGQIITVTEISAVHTVFNILNTLLLFPFAGLLVRIAETVIKDKDDASESALQHLDERILMTPSFAVENAVKEVIRMGNIAEKNVKISIDALLKKDRDKIQEVFDRERTINELQHGINHYLVKISNIPLSQSEHLRVSTLFHAVNDIERVGDHADNIAELAQSILENGTDFSGSAKGELEEITATALSSLECALRAYETEDTALAQKALDLEQQTDNLEVRMRADHLKRLVDQTCEPVAGIIFLDVLSNLERISDHASNIAIAATNGVQDKA